MYVKSHEKALVCHSDVERRLVVVAALEEAVVVLRLDGYLRNRVIVDAGGNDVLVCIGVGNVVHVRVVILVVAEHVETSALCGAGFSNCENTS